ncbi:MAG: hypothetical protein JOZ75_14690 [Candidatus Dormibacteraeota bacterium]|nr:hypothetical protein [Candidatus Dormibacteraeota bacterium]
MLATACGAALGYGGGYGTQPTSAPPTATGTVTVSSTKLGSILSDGQGRALYLFTKDTGASSTCTGSCLSVWPSFTTTGTARASSGVNPGLLGATTANGGHTQVTYNGHPLYYYVGDTAPGDTNGQNLDQFGGSWYVVSPSGAQVGQ